MNADLTLNTIVYSKSYDTKDGLGGSMRTSVARGINTPDELQIERQSYKDSTTKVAGKMYKLTVRRMDIDASLTPIKLEAYVIIKVPATAAQASIDTVVATFKAAIADTNLLTQVLASQN